MAEHRWRRFAAGSAVVLVLLIGAGVVLWQRCGLRGCPDVTLLNGYMPDEASVVVDRRGEEVGRLYVTRRVVIGVDSLPEHVPNAFIAMEDRRFWSHGGVDWQRVLGALAANVRAGGIEEGSSTITMQLARNIFPDRLPASERTLWRKMAEARVAREIEKRYTKREILELYLNQIYFGSGAWGIESAAEEYFGKSAMELTLSEAALLAALPRAPSRLNPRVNEAGALEGRAQVLRRMAEQGLITESQRVEAEGSELVLRSGEAKPDEVAPYFVESVRRHLEGELGSALYTEGYTIHTTLDLRLQRVSEEELWRHLRSIEAGRYGGYPHRTYASFVADTGARPGGTPYLQAALVLMDARTGDVLALVGGRDFEHSQFDRATQALRQPGSAFKPFVYAAALSAGYSPAHVLVDQPLSYPLGNGRVWEPRNYDGSYAGTVTLRNALTHSRNVPTVRLANDVGLTRVIGLAERMGLGRIPGNPSVVLGTAEVTPLRLTAAYAAFATLGERPEPRFVTRVEDRHGRTIWSSRPLSSRVIDPAAAFLTTSILQDVVDHGTGTGVRAAGFRAPAAGKTGTTQDAADAWFVGYTPGVVGTIWIGLDQRQRILRGATGGELAAPAWGRIMRRAGLSDGGWSPPPGIGQHTVDGNGMLLAEGCPGAGGARTEYFIRGTVPPPSCYPGGLAYGDSLDWYDSIPEYDGRIDPDDDGWWERLRRRVLGDSLRRPPPITPPARSPVPIPGGPARKDTAEAARRLPADTTRRPIGTPVPTPRRPPPDTGGTRGWR